MLQDYNGKTRYLEKLSLLGGFDPFKSVRPECPALHTFIITSQYRPALPRWEPET
jgi:hypothetical protein